MQPGSLRIRFFFPSVSIISRILTVSLMERTSRLLLGVEALPASLLLRFGAIITVKKGGFLNRNAATTRQLIRTARTLEAEWSQVCEEAWVQRTKEDESSTGRVLFCCISPYYGPFWLCARFETCAVHFFKLLAPELLFFYYFSTPVYKM